MNAQPFPQGPTQPAPYQDRHSSGAVRGSAKNKKWSRTTIGFLAFFFGLAMGSGPSIEDSFDYVDADFDLKVLCHYNADLLEIAPDERADSEQPHVWRAQALAPLIAAAIRGEQSFDGLQEIEANLAVATATDEPGEVQQSLERLDEFCYAWN